MPTTSNYALPYPASTAPPQVWVDMGNLANATDAALLAVAAMPVVKLVQTVAQTLAHNTATAITFTTETIDTAGSFNTGTSTTRVIPNKAGVYRVRGVASFAATTTYTVVRAFIRQNGSTAISPGARLGGFAGQGAGPVAVTFQVFCECLLVMNGTTDYIELMGQQANTGTAAQNTNVAAPDSCVLELEYVRP